MEILVQSFEPKIVNEIASELEKEYTIQVNEERDIGCGADWPFIPLLIKGMIGAGAIFFLGKKIEENLEAWGKIGNRISNLINKYKKGTPIFIDENAAVAVAINEIQKKVKINSIKLIKSNNLGGQRVDQVYYDDRDKNELSAMPYNFYIQIFEVNNSGAKYIFCIKSNGEIKYKDIFLGNVNDYEDDWDTVDKKYL